RFNATIPVVSTHNNTVSSRTHRTTIKNDKMARSRLNLLLSHHIIRRNNRPAKLGAARHLHQIKSPQDAPKRRKTLPSSFEPQAAYSTSPNPHHKHASTQTSPTKKHHPKKEYPYADPKCQPPKPPTFQNQTHQDPNAYSQAPQNAQQTH